MDQKFVRRSMPAYRLRHLVGVAVERQRLASTELTDATFGRLTPAWMIDGWIDVGVESVLARTGDLPRVLRLLGR